MIHAAGESMLWLDPRDMEGDGFECDPACSCGHDYVRGYGYAYDEGCGECMGHGLRPPVIHAVALAARNEQDLIELDLALREAEIPHMTIREPDAPYFGQITSIGIEPTKDKAKLRPFLKRFKLCAGMLSGRAPSSLAKEVGVFESSPAHLTENK